MTAITTKIADRAWAPDQSTLDPNDTVPDALILSCATNVGQVEGDEPAVRVAYVDDATAGFVAEGADITEASPDLAEVLIHTGKISQLVRLSNEQYRQAGTPNALANSVRRAVTVAADKAFLTQTAPTSPAVTPPAGLLNVTGIEAGGEVSGDLDVLVDLVATVQANGAQPSQVLLAPDAWASLRKLKTGTGSNAALLGAGTDDAAPRLLGIPVVVTGALSTGKGLVIDKGAVLSAVGPIMVAVSEHAYFGSDGTAIRCTWRFGANVVRPDRIGSFTVAASTET